ncbi:MAG: ABC transporter permease [Gammaproteobacteria bacterium]|jgi:putative ABC transport system permease protein|nr:ABC transporter permease [Gammaproteobacteria bacterium]
MNGGILEISLPGLAYAFLPAMIVLLIMWRWQAGTGTAVYAMLRMLVQLFVIGYVLIYIFDSDSYWVIAGVLTIMIVVASWIAVRPLGTMRRRSWPNALIAVGITSVLILALITQVVIGVEPWFSPRYVVPLGGMVVTGAMNAVSLAAERFQSETARDEPVPEALRSAFKTALIPITNMLFAVGIVSLPGMMTGQILSGVSPLIAAKYQIIVMAMFFGTGGIAAAIYLELESHRPGGA